MHYLNEKSSNFLQGGAAELQNCKKKEKSNFLDMNGSQIIQIVLEFDFTLSIQICNDSIYNSLCGAVSTKIFSPVFTICYYMLHCCF